MINVDAGTKDFEGLLQWGTIITPPITPNDSMFFELCKSMLGSSPIKLVETVIFGLSFWNSGRAKCIFERGQHIWDAFISKVR